MKRILDVVFKEPKGAGDLYWCEETASVLLRQPYDDAHVRWLTTTPACEADCSVREGLVLRAIDQSGRELFTESNIRLLPQDDLRAVKAGPFSCEVIKDWEKEYAACFSLHSYEKWVSWLMDAARDAGYVGEPDNWLYDAEYQKNVALTELSWLGKLVFLSYHKSKHRLCGRKWTRYEIMDESLETCLGLCGFQFDSE